MVLLKSNTARAGARGLWTRRGLNVGLYPPGRQNKTCGPEVSVRLQLAIASLLPTVSAMHVTGTTVFTLL